MTIAGLKLQDIGALLAIMLSLGGLLYNVGTQGQRLEDLGSRVTSVEAVQREDHDAIVRVQEGVAYLVERAKERERRK